MSKAGTGLRRDACQEWPEAPPTDGPETVLCGDRATHRMNAKGAKPSATTRCSTPPCVASEAARTAEELREGMPDLAFGPNVQRLTASFSVAELSVLDRSIDDRIERAAQAMYFAKQSGVIASRQPILESTVTNGRCRRYRQFAFQSSLRLASDFSAAQTGKPAQT